MEFRSVHNAFCTRRGVLRLAGSAGLIGMSGLASPVTSAAMTAPPNSGSIDYTDPKDNLYAFGKMWGTYGDKPVYTSWHGILFGSVGTKRLRPLFGYAGFGNAQCKILPNGHLRLRAKEGNFYTDLATGEVLETWFNPYTEENVEVFIFMNDRVRGELTLDMPRIFHGTEDDTPTLMNEATAQIRPDGSAPFIMPFEEWGSKIFLAWDYRHEYTNPVTPEGWPKASTGRIVNPSEHFTFYIPKEELEDRDRPTARFHGGFTRISPFWPWMRMGGSGMEDGKMMGRSFSFKEDIDGLGNIPRKVLDYVEKNYPDYLEPCDDWDDGAPKETWAAFAEQVPPETPGYRPGK